MIYRLLVQSPVDPLARNQVNSALHPFGVTKSGTSFEWGEGGNITSYGWQVTLCDPIWHLSSSMPVRLVANCHMLTSTSTSVAFT